jgi:hypothetical protein
MQLQVACLTVSTLPADFFHHLNIANYRDKDAAYAHICQ